MFNFKSIRSLTNIPQETNQIRSNRNLNKHRPSRLISSNALLRKKQKQLKQSNTSLKKIQRIEDLNNSRTLRLKMGDCTPMFKQRNVQKQKQKLSLGRNILLRDYLRLRSLSKKLQKSKNSQKNHHKTSKQLPSPPKLNQEITFKLQSSQQQSKLQQSQQINNNTNNTNKIQNTKQMCLEIVRQDIIAGFDKACYLISQLQQSLNSADQKYTSYQDLVYLCHIYDLIDKKISKGIEHINKQLYDHALKSNRQLNQEQLCQATLEFCFGLTGHQTELKSPAKKIGNKKNRQKPNLFSFMLKKTQSFSQKNQLG